MRIQHIGFDMDGTLIDSSQGIHQAFSVACENVGLLPPPLDLFRRYIGPPIQDIAKVLFPDAPYSALLEIKNIFRASYDNSLYKEYTLYEDVQDRIHKLSRCPGLELFVVTNKPSIPAADIIKRESLPFHVENIVGIDKRLLQEKGSKFSSKADALQYYLSRKAADPAASIYIGDTPSDKLAAAKCSMRFLAVGYGFHAWEEHELRNSSVATGFSSVYMNLLAELH